MSNEAKYKLFEISSRASQLLRWAFFHEAKRSIESFNRIYGGKSVKCVKVLPLPSKLEHHFLSFNFKRMWYCLFENPHPRKYDLEGYMEKGKGVDVTGVAGVDRKYILYLPYIDLRMEEISKFFNLKKAGVLCGVNVKN